MKAERQSNMELLRIVSMLMVLTVHADGAILGLPDIHGDLAVATSYDLWRLAIESVAIIGVNCFTMISGYFGIRLSWRNAASFLFECIFYAVLLYSLRLIFWPDTFTLKGWGESWLVLTHTHFWYVPAYFCLMLLSPILNAGLDSLDKRRYEWLLVAFIAFNLWCGWWWEGKFNPTGYTIVQLILVYMTARYIRLHISRTFIHRRRPLIIAIYILSTAGILLSSLYMASAKAFAYNSPLVLLSTVSLFMLFTTIKLQSRAINYAARSAFAVFLIHTSPVGWLYVLVPLMRHFKATLPGWQLLGAGAALIVGLYLLAMAVDPLRRVLSRALFKKG